MDTAPAFTAATHRGVKLSYAASSALAKQIESGAPAPVLTESLYQRFTSRGEADFASKVLSAMRFQFGGHIEKK